MQNKLPLLAALILGQEMEKEWQEQSHAIKQNNVSFVFWTFHGLDAVTHQ